MRETQGDFYIDLVVFTFCKFYFYFGENTILFPTFWGHSQFGLYILVVVNLVIVIFKL